MERYPMLLTQTRVQYTCNNPLFLTSQLEDTRIGMSTTKACFNTVCITTEMSKALSKLAFLTKSHL
jgi:hypothetical protein